LKTPLPAGWSDSRQAIVDNYRRLLAVHGDGPAATQNSPEGQLFRFERIAQVADLRGRSVLDLGCGLGDLYPFLRQRFGAVDYTGIDVVPEMVEKAAAAHPEARFLHRDVLVEGIEGTYDYVLLCGVFNNDIAEPTAFLKAMTEVAFEHCRSGIAFNFISRHVNFVAPHTAYHDPVDVFDFCLRSLSWKVSLHHHYERCDVAVFVYR
jgi:SAM-dependent methyltransferase